MTGPLTVAQAVLTVVISLIVIAGPLVIAGGKYGPTWVQRLADRCWLEGVVIWMFVYELWYAARVLRYTPNPWMEGLYILGAIWFYGGVIVLLVVGELSTQKSLIRESQTRFGALYAAVRDLFVITVVFTLVTVLLIQAHAVSLARPIPSGSRIWETFRLYAWHFLDAIPAIKAPQTLGWQISAVWTGFAGGLLLLVYKLAVIYGIFRLAKAAWARQEPTTPADAGPVVAKESSADLVAAKRSSPDNSCDSGVRPS